VGTRLASGFSPQAVGTDAGTRWYGTKFSRSLGIRVCVVLRFRRDTYLYLIPSLYDRQSASFILLIALYIRYLILCF
jgi:hypothetical protein